MRLFCIPVFVCISTLMIQSAHAANGTGQPRRGIASSSPANATPTGVAAAPITNAANDGGRHAPLNWDAFIDVQALIPSREDVFDKGVTLNDAALYLSKDFAHASAVVDLPFYTTLPGGTGNSFAFAQTKAQAYVHFNYGALGVRVGQYDTFFGLEANDSIARFFADQGLMKTLGIDPLTHTGAQVMYSMQALTLRAQVANANGAGTMGSGFGGGGSDPEVGGQVRFDGSNLYAAFGAEYGTYRTNGDDRSNYLVELMGGMVVNRFNLGAQLDWRKLSGVSAAGITQTYAGSGSTGWGVGLLGTYDANDELSFGLRVDYANKINAALAPLYTTNALLDDAFLISVGPSYKLQKDLVIRGDVSALKAKTVGTDSDTTLLVSASVVARF